MSSRGSHWTPGEGCLVRPGSLLSLLPSQQAAVVLDRGTWSLRVSSALLLSLQGRCWASPSEPGDRESCSCFQCCQFPVSLLFPPSQQPGGLSHLLCRGCCRHVLGNGFRLPFSMYQVAKLILLFRGVYKNGLILRVSGQRSQNSTSSAHV